MANTTGFTATTTFSDEVLSGADFCNHVSRKKLNKGVGFFYERDSFGYVFAEIVCEGCRDKGMREIAESIEVCADCGQEHPRKNTRQWRWYDFYEPQGDEPRIICNGCWELPKHVERMARDKADREFEFGGHDDEAYLYTDMDDDEDDHDEHDIDDQWEPGPTQEEEQPVVLFHIEFYRDRYYNLLGLASTPFQNWSRCIQRVHVAVK